MSNPIYNRSRIKYLGRNMTKTEFKKVIVTAKHKVHNRAFGCCRSLRRGLIDAGITEWASFSRVNAEFSELFSNDSHSPYYWDTRRSDINQEHRLNALDMFYETCVNFKLYEEF